MSTETEDLEIVIEADEKKPEETVVVEAKKPDEEAPKVVAPEEGIDALKQSLASERQARAEAERRANAAAQEAHAAKTETHDSNLALVANTIERVKSERDAAKIRYQQARQGGDLDAETEALLEMQDHAATLQQLETGKAAMEQAPKPAQPQPVQTADPVEALASQMSPRSAQWVRDHPQFARDTRLYQRMLAAHNLAVTDGKDADTDDYFDAIETTLGLRQQAPVQDEDPSAGAAQVTQRRQSPPPGAPVSHGTQLNGQRPNTVRLSAEEREIAKLNGMTDQEYAKQKLALQREGKLTTH